MELTILLAIGTILLALAGIRLVVVDILALTELLRGFKNFRRR